MGVCVCVDVQVCLCVDFVMCGCMCGCFGNMCTCIYCVFCIVPFMYNYSLSAFVYFCNLCIFHYVYVFVLLCVFCSVHSVFIVPTCTLRLPRLRFFRAFSSLVRQMPGYNSQRRGTARNRPN